MLFLIRTAFWLMIIVLLLPTDAQQRSEVYGTAQAAVNDVATFCDRNPETCARGKDAFSVFVQKAQFGARMGRHLRAELFRFLLAILLLAVGLRFGLELVLKPAEPFSISVQEARQ